MKRLVSFSSIVLWSALLFFVGTSALQAQEGPPDNVSDTWIVVPKAGHGDEF